MEAGNMGGVTGGRYDKEEDIVNVEMRVEESHM